MKIEASDDTKEKGMNMTIEEALQVLDETMGKMLLINTSVLSLDATSYIQLCIAQIESARAFLELAAVTHSRALAARQLGR